MKYGKKERKKESKKEKLEIVKKKEYHKEKKERKKESKKEIVNIQEWNKKRMQKEINIRGRKKKDRPRKKCKRINTE